MSMGSATQSRMDDEFWTHAYSLPEDLAVAAIRLWFRVPEAQQDLFTRLVKAYCRLRDDAVLTLATGEDAHLRSALDDLGEVEAASVSSAADTGEAQ